MTEIQVEQLGENRGGGMTEAVADWTPDRAVTLAALEAIDHRQRPFPACALCEQRAVKLDRFGLCSKTSEAHQDWRAGVRNDMKAGAR